MEIKLTKKQYKNIKRFVWNRVKVVPTNERMTDAAGLGSILEAFDQSSLAKELAKCLPERNGNRSHGSHRMALTLISSFIYGYDSLDDLEYFRQDPYLNEALSNKVAAPRTMGDFLRDFKVEHIEALNCYLSRMSKTYRKYFATALDPEYQYSALAIDVDSTDHVQCAEKMEGLAFNYKGNWCLDSQVAYDEYGFCHGMQLRAGNTKSGVDAEELIKLVFGKMKFKEKKYFRGDSAYCEQDVIKECLALGVTYTIAAHDNIKWKERRSEIKDWHAWEYTQAQKEKAAKRGIELPKVELGRIYWQPGWAENIRVPLIIKRTWKSGQNSLSKITGQPCLWITCNDSA